MRGKVPLRHAGHRAGQITPACAGKSYSTTGFSSTTGDHPRVCGEKGCCPLLEVHAEGSPPRVRGKVCPNQIRLKDLRITPAYAGKSHYDLYRFFFTWDHPRVCGEKKSAISPSYVKYGSPPRMRGKADRQGQAVGLYRITPAYAGKSVLLSINVAAQQDHPRVCGEKRKATL